MNELFIMSDDRQMLAPSAKAHASLLLVSHLMELAVRQSWSPTNRTDNMTAAPLGETAMPLLWVSS